VGTIWCLWLLWGERERTGVGGRRMEEAEGKDGENGERKKNKEKKKTGEKAYEIVGGEKSVGKEKEEKEQEE
jgi:hypothetical protein